MKYPAESFENLLYHLETGVLAKVIEDLQRQIKDYGNHGDQEDKEKVLLFRNFEKKAIEIYNGCSWYQYKILPITKLEVCEHLNVNREDGLDECLDCGTKNY